MAHRILLALTALAFGALLALHARPAQACGGFFCGQVPVDQSGEHLLFAVEEGSDGQRQIVAHIQVQYMGPADEFAWILPLPSNPIEISTGSNAVFQTLRQTTEPQFRVDWLPDVGVCTDEDDFGSRGAPGLSGADGDFAADGPEEEGGNSVQVLQQSAVGPYESVVVASDDAQDLIDWLNENHYTVPDNSLAAIQSYVNAHHVFLALKLQNDRTVGDITPIVLRMVEEGPCIPLILTAIAATPDMPIYAWVLAEHGLVSVGNFYEIQLNEAAIAWFASGRNYRPVATAAVNQAGGHGFIREYAGPSSILAGQLYDAARFDLSSLRNATDASMAIQWVISRFPFDGNLIALLSEFVPMPQELADQGIDEQSYYGCPGCWGEASTPEGFDPAGLATAVDDVYIRPLRDAQELVDRHPYLTRMFTTISPDEMTEDPLFRQNPDVPDVTNVRVAQAQRLCGWMGRERSTAPIRVTLPSGRAYTLTSDDPLHPGAPRLVDDDGNGIDDRDESAPDWMPALQRAIRHSEHGAGDVVIDNRTVIDDALHGTGGGCAVAHDGTAALPVLGLVGLALLGLGRRRRRS